MALISDNVATVHILGTVLIALFGAMGCSAPLTATLLARRQPKIMRYLSFVQLALTALGAGVVISTALLHILPEGSEMLVNGGLGGEAEAEPSDINDTAFYLSLPSSSSSSPASLATTNHNHKQTTHSSRKSKKVVSLSDLKEEPEKDDDDDDDEPYPYGPMLMLVGLVATYIVDSEIHRFASAHQEATMKAHITEIGIATHSVLIGVAFGSMSKVDSVNTLAIALMLHQLCEGFAMGPVIYKGARTVLHAVVLIGIFAVATPIGIGIGALALQYGEPGSKHANLSQGILSCLAAGMLMYVGAVEFLGGLQHSMEHSEAAHLEKVPKDETPKDNNRETVRIQDGTHRHSHRMFFPNADDNEDEEKRTLLSSKRSLRASSSAPASTPYTPADDHHHDEGGGAFGNPHAAEDANKNTIDEDEVELPATFLQDYPTLGRMTSHVMVIIGGSAMAVLAMYS